MICITGTPGTGKSSVINALKSRGYTCYEMIDVASDCITGEENYEKVTDTECLKNKKVDGIVAGHLSHYMKCDKVIVLRSHLLDLEKRLSSREYDKRKIMDNLEAEAIDLIGYESEKLHPGNVYEVLNSNIDETVNKVLLIIAGNAESGGRIDLVEEIMLWY